MYGGDGEYAEGGGGGGGDGGGYAEPGPMDTAEGGGGGAAAGDQARRETRARMADKFVAGKLFIGGVDSAVITREMLRAYAEGWGPVADAIVMPGKKYGFVTFADPETAMTFLDTRDHVLEGRRIEARAAVPKSQGGGIGMTTKMFVGGTGGELNEEDLRAHFLRYGAIEAVHLPKTDGAPRGFGFVTFVDEVSTEKALLVAHVVAGRRVDVKRALPRENQGGPPAGGRDAGGRDAGGRPGGRGDDGYGRAAPRGAAAAYYEAAAYGAPPPRMMYAAPGGRPVLARAPYGAPPPGPYGYAMYGQHPMMMGYVMGGGPYDDGAGGGYYEEAAYDDGGGGGYYAPAPGYPPGAYEVGAYGAPPPRGGGAAAYADYGAAMGGQPVRFRPY